MLLHLLDNLADICCGTVDLTASMIPASSNLILAKSTVLPLESISDWSRPTGVRPP
jgi:hypothetical protein